MRLDVFNALHMVAAKYVFTLPFLGKYFKKNSLIPPIFKCNWLFETVEVNLFSGFCSQTGEAQIASESEAVS